MGRENNEVNTEQRESSENKKKEIARGEKEKMGTTNRKKIL